MRAVGRRGFLGAVGIAGAAVLSRGARAAAGRTAQTIFFTSAGKTCLIREDGSGFRVLEVSAPGQAAWQPCGFFPDGRVLLLSMEPVRHGPGKPFEQFYHQTPTHIWAHDPARGTLDELAAKDRLAPFYTPALLLSEGRMLVQVVRDAGGQIFNIALDGSDARPFTQLGEGLPYGFSLSPDGRRVAFHLASPEGYQVFTSGTDGANRVKVAAHPEHLYFGPGWSRDGQWLSYQDCRFGQDPGHDWADVCVGRPDGSEHRVLTTDQAAWFAATYGSPAARGGGSDVPGWTADGRVVFARRQPGSKVAWEFQPDRPDVDHFNRDYKPESASGGTSLCAIDPKSGAVESLTPATPGQWDFRACASPDGRRIAFCRCAAGEMPALWIMDRDGGNARMLSRGIGDAGVDHPRWQPSGPTT